MLKMWEEKEMTTLSPEHYAFLDKLIKPLEWEIINPSCHKSNHGNFHIHEIGGEFELHKGRVDSFFHISDHSTLEQAKAAARKDQLEAIAKGADLSMIPVWRDIDAAAKTGREVLCLLQGCDSGKCRMQVLRFIKGEWILDGESLSNAWNVIGYMNVDFPYPNFFEALPTPPDTEK
mgnify:CR=1 FL=1